MSASTYVCACCRETFSSDQEDGPALQEAERRYGSEAGAMAKVCDKCYDAIKRFEDAQALAAKAPWN